jgi:tetratricopeptide (TPR) repeat protein
MALEDFKNFEALPSSGETQTIYYRQSAFGGGTDQIISAQGQIHDYVLNYIGLTEFKLKHYNTAINYFDSAIQINPHEADYFVHRGLVKQELNNIDEAEADYRHALKLNEDHSIARHNLSILLNGKSDAAAAEVELNEAIIRNPDLSYPYLERAYQRQASGNFTGALLDYNKAISLNPDDVDSWVNRGLVKEKMNDFPGAVHDFTKAISVKENYEKAWFCRGNALTKQNKFKEAADDYSIAILYYPEYTQAYINRAIVRHRLGQLKEACSDIQKATSLNAKGIEKIRMVVCK